MLKGLRWKDDVELDLRNMGVNRWTRTLEGTEWESLVRGANAKFKGLHCERRRCTVQISIRKIDMRPKSKSKVENGNGI